MFIDDIINSINGRDEDRLPKCAVSLDKYVFDAETKKPVSQITRALANVEINITRIPSGTHYFVQVDFTFLSAKGFEINTLWEFLQEYGKVISLVDDETKEIPQLFVTLIPLSYEGRYYFLCSLPIFWSLMALKPGETANTIRVLFDSETVGLYETNDVDFEKISRVVDDELAARRKEEEERLAEREEAYEKNRKELLGESDDETIPSVKVESTEEPEQRFRVIE